MANKNLFRTVFGKLTPYTSDDNHEGAPAYVRSPRAALAQFATTGCLNATFYASAERQLGDLISLAYENDPSFVAQTAVFSREKGLMKDVPALLCATLSFSDPELFGRVFPRVIDSTKMLRNFVQIVRSGVVGRRSLGSRPKRLVREWLATRTEEELFRGSIGRSPSLSDVVKMVHPKPATAERDAFYAYLLGREHDAARLPDLVRAYERYRAARASKDARGRIGQAPDVPFQMLTSLTLETAEWTDIAKHASWTTTRMNLNTFARHGVFGSRAMTKLVAERLRDRDAILASRAFPYQLMTAWLATDEVPALVRQALGEAMEVAIENVPAIEGRTFLCCDVSGSMRSPVTGHRTGATTKVRCVDVAALLAAAMLRKNPNAEVLPFENQVVNIKLSRTNSVMTNATKLAAIGGGGTNCSAPLARLNERKARGDLVVYVSDNESWIDARGGRGTETMHQWKIFKAHNPGAKLICVDLQPSRTAQAVDGSDVLNVGGFSDQVFEVMRTFASANDGADGWVKAIERIAV